MKSSSSKEQKPAQAKPVQEQLPLRCMRISILVSAAAIFYSGLNPARVTSAIGQYVSLLTSALSYDALTGQLTSRAFKNTGITPQTFTMLQIASAILIVGIVVALVGTCMSYGNKLMRTKGRKFPLIGAVVMAVGLGGIIYVWAEIAGAATDKIPSMFPLSIPVFCVLIVLILVTTIMAAIQDRKDPAPLEEKMEMQEKYHLFLLFVPILALCFVFCYLPLWGWRYAFFDYQAGDSLSMDNFVGFKWFTILFQNETTRNDIIRVMINTLAMSGLGILTSWVPMIFAVFLMQLPSKKFRRFVQNATTIPNFIGWVIVYAIALAMFSTDGFVNSFLNNVCGIPADTNYLMDPSHMWLKMLLWGMWKGTGWSAIIYVSSIAGIDPGLYEAAEVDGANRWQKMWNVTIPQLMPTFFVLLLMSIANILSNGMEQYLVFSNAMNSKSLEVLDLYVYNLGIGNGQIPMSTAIGMFKSIVSVVLLFGANAASKKLRGESII